MDAGRMTNGWLAGWQDHLPGIRNEPSKRTTSPLRYVFSIMCCTNMAYSSASVVGAIT